MAFRDMIPWSRQQQLAPQRDAFDPFTTLHREMNRLFDDAFRSFDIAPFSSQAMGWPNVEVNETGNEVKVIAELPGLEEKDVNLELRDGLLTISGEKRSETEDKERRFSERYYGRFERSVPVDDVDQDKVEASFKNGVLTVTLPKLPTAQQKVKRIAINGR
jgi:HSP20 family protein